MARRSSGLLLLLALFASLLFTANSLNFRGRVRERKLRAAVCILGQLGRTEISSKLENLIKPNLNIVDMHVFVLLQGGQANFDTNVGSSECSIAPRSLEDARGHFARFVGTSASPAYYRDYIVNASMWPQYQEVEGEERFVRVNNNLVQYVSWRNCAKAISAHEMETGKFFDVVLRVRDNSLVYKPFKLLDLLQHLSPQKPMRLPSSEADFQHIRSLPVLVKGCSGWGGHNDKVMLIPRQWMDPSLSRIADDFCITDKAWGSKNSETFLKEILASYGVPVHEEHDPGRFPIADGRCEDGSQFCLVEYAKDCWGEGSGYQQCKLNYLKPKPIKYMKKQSAGEHNSDKRPGSQPAWHIKGSPFNRSHYRGRRTLPHRLRPATRLA